MPLHASRLSLLTDVDIFLDDLDPYLFPGLPWGVKVHRGFRNSHAKTISIIAEEVRRLLGATGARSVTCVRLLSLIYNGVLLTDPNRSDIRLAGL